MPKPALREIPTPPELSTLQAALAQTEVVAEMSNPGGLRLDAPVTDPVSQYKADVRAVLAGHPQDLDTALAAQAVVVETFAVPEAETAPPIPPPEPEPPELTLLVPQTASNLIPAITVKFVGGPFEDGAAVACADGADLATTFVSLTELRAELSPTVADAESTLDCYVRQGDDETAHLPFTFTFTYAPPPEVPPPEEEPAAATQPVVEGA
jgi:hypothetical protein